MSYVNVILFANCVRVNGYVGTSLEACLTYTQPSSNGVGEIGGTSYVMMSVRMTASFYVISTYDMPLSRNFFFPTEVNGSLFNE